MRLSSFCAACRTRYCLSPSCTMSAAIRACNCSGDSAVGELVAPAFAGGEAASDCKPPDTMPKPNSNPVKQAVKRLIKTFIVPPIACDAATPSPTSGYFSDTTSGKHKQG